MTISKRTGKILTLILAFIMSVALVVALKTYLTDSQIQISFNVSPSVTGKYRATFYFTDEKGKNIDQNNTNNIVSQDKKFTSGEYTQIEFKTLIKPHKKLQKFQLTLNYLGDPNKVEGSSADIKEIQLNREPIDLLKDHLNKITFKDNNAIYIQPNDLNLRPRYTHLALYGVLIIIFIGTGVFYNLLRFVLNQRARQHTRSADLAFIIVITVTIMIPAMGINTTPNISSPDENRMLSEYKPFFTDDWQHPINLNYMKDFENWFNDRFGIRKKLVTTQKRIQLAINKVVYVPHAGACQKSNNWCFNLMDGGTEIDDFFGRLSFRERDIEYIYKIAFNTKKQIYVLIYPIKTEIYPEKVEFLKQNKKSELHFSDRAYTELKKINLPNLHIINVASIFKEEKKRSPDKLLYFIDEHHVTEYGNKVVVEYLNKLLKTNYATVNLDNLYHPENLNIASGEFLTKNNTWSDYWNTMIYGQTWGNVFGHSNRKKLNNYFKPHKYQVYSLSEKYRKDITFTFDAQCDANIHLHNSTVKKSSGYVLGKSFVETLSKMLATSFSDIYRRRINTSCGYRVLSSKEAILQIKKLDPDFVFIAYWVNGFFGFD